QMALEDKARLESAIVPNGSGFVYSRLASHFGESSWVGEQQRGISNLFFSRQLARAVDDDWPAVLSALERIRETLLTRRTMMVNATVDAASWTQIGPAVDAFLAELPTREAAPAI